MSPYALVVEAQLGAPRQFSLRGEALETNFTCHLTYPCCAKTAHATPLVLSLLEVNGRVWQFVEASDKNIACSCYSNGFDLCTLTQQLARCSRACCWQAAYARVHWAIL